MTKDALRKMDEVLIGTLTDTIKEINIELKDMRKRDEDFTLQLHDIKSTGDQTLIHMTNANERVSKLEKQFDDRDILIDEMHRDYQERSKSKKDIEEMLTRRGKLIDEMYQDYKKKNANDDMFNKYAKFVIWGIALGAIWIVLQNAGIISLSFNPL